MTDPIEISFDLPLFEGVPREKIPRVLSCLNATVSTYEKGECAFPRDTGRTVTGYLCSGRVQLVACDFWGNRSILGDYRAGSAIAANRFFKIDLPLPADVIACEPCTVLSFNLDAHVEAKPCCMAHVDRIRANLALISMKMSSDLLDRLSIASMRSTRDKVLAYLTNEAKTQGSAVFDIPYNRQELADALYVERSALSHELGKLQKEGWISFSRNHFELLRPTEMHP